MKLEHLRETKDLFTGKASDLARQSAFAGIAMIWIFKTDTNAGPVIPPALLWPTGAFVLSLGLDFLQYVYQSVAWTVYYWKKERLDGVKEDVDFFAPRLINWPAYFFFWSKLAVVAAAYVLLFRYAMQQLIHPT